MATDILRNRDLEYDDLERNELLTGEPRYVEDEVRNSTFSLILGGLGGVMCLTAMILCWILYWRERTRTFLWHSIWLIGAMLFGFICAAWGATSGTAVKTGRQPSSMFSLFVFLGGLLLAVYMFATSLWLIFYRPVHFSYLIGLRTNNDLWNHRMTSGSSFEEGWTSSRRMMWWVIFFSLASGVCFGFCAYAAKSIVWNRFQLTRIGLYAACLFMILSGFIVIYWAKEADLYTGLNTNSFSTNLVTTLKVLAIITIVAGFINAIINFTKIKLAYFISGILLILLFIILVSCTGSLWRELRYSQRDRLSNSCSDNLVPVHESQLENVCINGGKYLPVGATCNKEHLVSRWESGNGSELRFLNPGCCELGQTFLYRPYMYLAFWSTVMLLCVGIAIACNYYLADTSEYLSNANKPSGIIDYIGLALIVLMVIGWILYFIFAPAPVGFNSRGTYVRAYNDPQNNLITGFDLVPDSIVTNANPSIDTNGCQNYNSDTMVNPIFSNTDTTCSTDCIERVAILTRNSKITPPTDFAGANLGSDTSRLNFFPGCTDSSKDYIFIYGTNSQIKSALNTMKICPTRLDQAPQIYFYHDQVPKNSIGNNGLRVGEDGYSQLTSSDAPNCGVAFSSAVPATCNGKCTVSYSLPTTFDTGILKGSLFYVKNSLESTDIHPDAMVTATANNNPVGGTSTLVQGGIFTIDKIPRYADTEYYLTLQIRDSKNVFLPKNVDIRIPRKSTTTQEIPAGKIQLLTADGNICDVAKPDCIAAQKRLNGNIVIPVKDTSNPDRTVGLEGASIAINSGHTLNGQTYKTATTDSTGSVKADAIPYDAYTLVATKTGYLPAARRVDLQAPHLNVLPLFMRTTNSPDIMRVVADMNEQGADMDLKMNIRSDKGASCQVSPYNKYCAYASHLSDVAFGTGQEVIGMKRMAVAEYLSFISASPDYDRTCGNADTVAAAKAHYEGWSWGQFKQSRPIELLNIVVTTVSNIISGQSQSGSNLGADIRNAIMAVIPKNRPVENDDDAKKEKLILNRGGKTMSSSNAQKMSTYIPSVNATQTTVPYTYQPVFNITSNKTEQTALTTDPKGSFNTTTVVYTMTTNKDVQNGTNVTKVYFYDDKHDQIERYNVFTVNRDTGDKSEGWEKIDYGRSLKEEKQNRTERYTETQQSGAKRFEYFLELLKNGFDTVNPHKYVESRVSIAKDFPKQNNTESSIQTEETYTTNGSRKSELVKKLTNIAPDIETSDEQVTLNMFHTSQSDTEYIGQKRTTKRVSDGVIISSYVLANSTTISKPDGTRLTKLESKTDSNDATNGLISETRTLSSERRKDNTFIERETTSTTTKVSNTDKKVDVVSESNSTSNGGKVSTYVSTTVYTASGVTTTDIKITNKAFSDPNTITKLYDSSIITTDNKTNAAEPFIQVDQHTKDSEIFGNKTISARLTNRTELNKTLADKTQTQTIKAVTHLYLNHTSNNTNVTYLLSDETTMTIGKPETAKTTSTWTVIVYDYKNGQKTEYRNDLAKPIVSTADKLVTRRLLAAFAHNQGTDKNFILVNCFTGFGQASVVQSNLATVKEPTFDDCIPTLNANFPQFTLAKLRDQVGK
jgi:hypothetical protein